MGEIAGVDPEDHATVSGFKSAVYDAAGTGTWLDDAKLSVVWREAHDEEIPEHLEALI